jgi:outer membrane protein assembly factor BamB
MHAQRIACVLAAAALAGGGAFAQVGRGGSEWLTAYGDAQRTSWIRQDAKISVATMSAPGFELQWTSKLDNQPRRTSALHQGVTANGVTLFVPMSVVAGSSNNVYGLDNDTGYVVWKRHFSAALPASTAACPGGIASAATRIVSLEPPAIAAPPRAGGRGAVGYRSVVGQPGEGVPVDANGVSPGRANAPPPAPGAGRRQGGGGGGGRRGAPVGAGIPGAPADTPGTGLGRVSGVAYVVSSDGQLHVVGLPSGKDIQKPAPFLPANARWSDPIAVGTTMYAATSGTCGGAPQGVWAIDLESAAKPVVSWKTNGGPIVGAIAFTGEGTLIATVGPGPAAADGKANAVVALDPKTLEVKDWFTPGGELAGVEIVTGPTIFRHRDAEVVAVGTNDGRIVLMNAASLGGDSHSRPMYASPSFPGATIATPQLSTWQEMTVTAADAGGPPNAPPNVTWGTRWILVPLSGRLPAEVQATNGAVANGTIVALKLNDGADGMSVQAAWTSHDLVRPATPIVVNGVVFALGSGQPAPGASSAVLHAYDGATGKPLWNSADAMKTFASPGSFWSAMGQVYVGTHDGTLHAFGFLDERR